MKREVAIVGAGYVGVPLAQVFAEAGRSVLLVDRDAGRVAQLNRGESYIDDVASESLQGSQPGTPPRLEERDVDLDRRGDRDRGLEQHRREPRHPCDV